MVCKISEIIFSFVIFKFLFSQNRLNGCDCRGPDGRLDTKISQIDSCHISMSYVAKDIKCHIMAYDAYDISQFGIINKFKNEGWASRGDIINLFMSAILSFGN
jgi:hypothetical protein